MITHQELLNLPKQGLSKLISELQNSLTKSKLAGETVMARAKIIKRGLLLIRYEIFDEEKYPRTIQYKNAFLALSDAYSIAKQITEGLYKNAKEDRQKIQQCLNWRTQTAIQKLEEL